MTAFVAGMTGMRYTKKRNVTFGLKQIFIFFVVIAAVVAAFIYGADVFLRWVVDVEKPDAPSVELPASGTEIKAPAEGELTPTVLYDGRAFRPSRIIRDGSGSIGCLVVLVNRSQAALKIGLNPHSISGDPGPDYGDIASGDKLIFDPRFVGITELTFHNHRIPEQEFAIEFGPKCQL